MRAGAVLLATLLVAGACSSGSGAGSRDSAADDTGAAGTTTATPASPSQRAEDAYLAGFPLVTTVRTMQTFARLAGINKLLRTPTLAGANSHFVVAPNHDTLYALAILDLRNGPQALTLPEIDRYHVFQVIDAWMDTVTNIGTRGTGGRPGTWVFTAPGAAAPALPPGAHQVKSPTNQLVLLGRVRAIDDADAPAAFAATADVRLQPLSALTGGPPQPDAEAMAPPPGSAQDVGGNGIGYFDELGDALAVNPPTDDVRRRAIDAAAPLGVGAGRHPSTDSDVEDRNVLTDAVTRGNASVATTSGIGGTTVNGWSVNLHIGDQHTTLDLRGRAVVAKHFWGANVAAESVYPLARTAGDGQPLDGATRRYRIHLPAGGEPPVGAFWSYTVYGEDSFLVPNPANRFSISGQTPGLVRNPDGSLDLYVASSPPAGHEANWLPSPAGPFQIVLRLYLPGRAILDGTYRYPAVDVLP